MTASGVNLQAVLLRAYRVLNTKDEFGAAQLLGALLLLAQHAPREMDALPQHEWHQTTDDYLEALLTQFRLDRAADAAHLPSLADLALSGFSFRRPLSGTPPTVHWSKLIAEVCSVMAPVWAPGGGVASDWGQELLAVLLSRPAFVRAFAPTPPDAAQLAAQLLQVRPGQQVLNLQCRLGQVLLALPSEVDGGPVTLEASGSEMQAVSLCAALLLLSGRPTAHLEHLPLRADAPLLGLKKESYNWVVAHPPVEAVVGQTRQYVEELVIEQVLGTLKPNGRAVVIVSGGYLHRRRPDPVIRRCLVADGWLRAVIQLPGTTKDPGGQPSLLVLENTQAHDAVVFVDLSETEPAEWRHSALVSGLIEPPTAVPGEGWTALSPAAGGPTWRAVPRAEIVPEADLSPARYLQPNATSRMTKADVLAAQQQYQVAWGHLQHSNQKFNQFMTDLFEL